ncbi:MAG TPA: FliI/YscN family ATPase, partial [Verrucomicrobiae bacterium]|nr:FliI/YscN family ATPase [Verrucomicrobiae bacterium]
MALDPLAPYHSRVRTLTPFRVSGTVTDVVGLLITSRGPWLPVGAVCKVYPLQGENAALAEVVGFRGEHTLLMPLGELRGVGPGSRVVALHKEAHYSIGEGLLGRVIDGLGRPIDGGGTVAGAHSYPIYVSGSNPLDREGIGEPIDVGIRAVNGLVTCGKGQRVAIMAGAGVGKSTLLAMIARNTRVDIKVIALIGERGREVEDFVERGLPAEDRERTIVVAATSADPPLVRVRGAFLATAIAEYFCDRGQDVLLLVDSLSRFAMAQREAGLAVGEPPSTKGYTPSVFALLPRLIERAGTWKGKGSITALYTVLMEGDDMHEPVSDAVRSLTDGHIQLSRRLAEQSHYPAIDVLSSVSRVRSQVTALEQRRLVAEITRLLAAYRDAEDLIQIGAYVKGRNPDVDRAL